MLGGTGYAEKVLAAANYPCEGEGCIVKGYMRLSFPVENEIKIIFVVFLVLKEAD